MSSGVRGDMYEALLNGAHLAVPDDVSEMLARHVGGIGGTDVTLYLADLEQTGLHPVPRRDRVTGTVQAIDSTLAGRCYQRVTIEQAEGEHGVVRVWVPVLDGTERLGVLEVMMHGEVCAESRNDLRAFAGLAAELVMTKALYGDLFQSVRRTRPLSVAAELLWRLLPPLTFANEELVIAATLAPPYDLGGDAFDYAVDRSTAHVAVFDAMGHGLQAGLLATIAMAAYRASRRQRAGLVASAAAIDDAIAGQYVDSSFVTGVLAELDLGSGGLRYCIAGHPRPLLLRSGRIVRELDGPNGGPLGLGRGVWSVAEEALEPDDRVILFTDGVVEARDEAGSFLGDAGFGEFIERASHADAPPPETLRRLLRSILERQHAQLQDDATVVMMEWRGVGSRKMIVQDGSSIDPGRELKAPAHTRDTGPHR